MAVSVPASRRWPRGQDRSRDRQALALDGRNLAGRGCQELACALEAGHALEIAADEVERLAQHAEIDQRDVPFWINGLLHASLPGPFRCDRHSIGSPLAIFVQEPSSLQA